MKFKAIVEYEYPTEHKPPVKAEIVLHGDRIITDNIQRIEQEPKSEWEHDHDILKAYSDGANGVLDKIKAEIKTKYDSIPWGNNDCDNGWVEALEWVSCTVIDKYKAECEG